MTRNPLLWVWKQHSRMEVKNASMGKASHTQVNGGHLLYLPKNNDYYFTPLIDYVTYALTQSYHYKIFICNWKFFKNP